MSDVKRLPKITSKEQLKAICDGLNDQGFGYYSEYEMHNRKVQSIISKNNKYRIDDKKFSSEVQDLISDVTDYEEMDKIVSKYFEKFKPDDKIKELLNKFYLKALDSGRSPGNSPDRKEIIEWVRFKKKYGIKGEPFGTLNYISVYNLDRNILKINSSGDYGTWEFDRLYELLFNEKPNEWSNGNGYGEGKVFGKWQDLGKIQVKVYQNGNMDVKGDIKKLREFLYKSIRRENCIIFYNKKKEIRANKD